MTRFILVRHGQTEWNRTDRYRGRADIALDAAGLAQAAAAAGRIAARWQVDALYASPLRRAIQTAEAIAGRSGLQPQPHPGLLDIDFGLWQGLEASEVMARWPEQAAAWQTAPGALTIPGGESLAGVRARGVAAVRELAARHADQTVVLVGHTVVNRAILLGILGLDDNAFWRLGQDTGTINVFVAGSAGFLLVTLNDTCHLE